MKNDPIIIKKICSYDDIIKCRDLNESEWVNLINALYVNESINLNTYNDYCEGRRVKDIRSAAKSIALIINVSQLLIKSIEGNFL